MPVKGARLPVVPRVSYAGAMDVGVLLPLEPRRAARTAKFVEELGFASLIVPDSQNLVPDVWGQLMLAATATTRLRLGPGVSNSVTRDVAVGSLVAIGGQLLPALS